jgi:hypothetical protein
MMINEPAIISDNGCQDLPHFPLLRRCTETMIGDIRVCQTDYQAPGPTVWVQGSLLADTGPGPI